MALLEAQTKQGTLRGRHAWNQAISVFKGIPFAKPPVGDLRWRAPQAPDPWEGIREADEFADIPMQLRQIPGGFFKKESYPVELPRSEDCLYLNVWTPAETPDEKLPVNLWIYGGGFTCGYANKLESDGEAFAQRGVVFVSCNYRVNSFGFLSHPELSAEDSHGSSGNYGILDQLAAIDWIRENIAAFGGDPDCITIQGQSAGAMSVQTLAVSPLTKGRIRRAVMESGGGFGGIMTDLNLPLKQAEELGIRFLEFLGVSSIAEARKIDEVTILEKGMQFIGVSGMNMLYAPRIDNYLLPASVYEMTRRGAMEGIDVLMGTTSNEASAYPLPVSYPSREEFKVWASERYHAEDGDLLTSIGDSEDAVREFQNNKFTYEMTASVIGWEELQTHRGLSSGYIYKLCRDIPDHKPGGTFHSGEHMYIFQTLNRSWRRFTGIDYDLSRNMCDYWTNFVKTGDPNGEYLPRWEKFTPACRKTMILDQECRMEDQPGSPIVRYLAEQDLKA